MGIPVVEGALPYADRQALRQSLLEEKDAFITNMPKIELHLHIEGCLTPELRWRLAQKNGIVLGLKRKGQFTTYDTLEQVQHSYASIQAREGHSFNNAEERFTFFEAYYGGCEVLLTSQDFYDLAMTYFEHAASMNVRYCEPFFDPQAHTRRGVRFNTVIDGFRRAQVEAKESLQVESKFVMCIMRDMSPDSALEHYKLALTARDLIVGIGLDSDEYRRPPSLFEPVFSRARADGFHLTCHCDVGQEDTHEHIRQVVCLLGATGAERLDHGLNAAEKPELMEMIRAKGVGMTVCPWAYLRHEPLVEIFPRIRTLYDAGIKVSINSDDPAYMDDSWITHDMLVAKKMCNFSDSDMVVLAGHAIDMCWATDDVKAALRNELGAYAKSAGVAVQSGMDR